MTPTIGAILGMLMPSSRPKRAKVVEQVAAK
jgi:hypothetical protein